jgi:hypothetical protein
MTAIVVRIEAVDSPDGEAPAALAEAAKAGCNGRHLSEL